jgi:hypothetical protein
MEVSFISNSLSFSLARSTRAITNSDRVIFSSKLIMESFSKSYPDFDVNKLQMLNGSFWSDSLNLLNLILKAKKINIFHECCWPILDLFLITTTHKVVRFEILAMRHSKKIEGLRNLNKILGKRTEQGVKPFIYLAGTLFFDYYSPNQIDIEITLKKRYDKKFEFVDAFSEGLSFDESGSRENSVIILLDVEDWVIPKNQTVLLDIIENLLNLNFAVYIKEHPRVEFRTDPLFIGKIASISKQIIILDPAIVAAKYVNDFKISHSISVSSTAPLFSNIVNISLINLLNSIDNQELKMSHLTYLKAKTKCSIQFPKNEKELYEYFR